ncbi:MAG: tail fiber domain-containing protein [Candidatus Zixiibacteriota bacterium]
MRALSSSIFAIASVLAVLTALAGTSLAAIPTIINYQGRLTDAGGTPVPDGSYSVVFTIYDSPSGGTSKWTETQSVTTSGGLFSVLLGTFTPIVDSVFKHSFRCLGIKVGTDPELSPRTRLVSVPYANRVSDIDGASGGAISGSTSIQGNLSASGNVGIGTASPAERLTVAGSMEIGTTSADYQYLRMGGGNSSGFLYGSYPNFGDGIHLGYNYAGGSTSGTYILPNWGGGTSRLSLGYGDIGLYVEATAVAPSFPCLYVASNHRVGIWNTSPAYPLDVAGSAHASSFPTSSDNRLKKNIKPLTNALEKVRQIRGVSFDWNETYEKMGRSTGHREIGVIAQEVEKVYPELITTWGDEKYRAVDYGRLSAVLIEAIKDQQKQIEELRDKIAKLEKDKQLAKAGD